MNWATRKSKVHEITPLVSEILDMHWCRNHVTVARIVGCSRTYVRQIRAQAKSKAHVFLSRETLQNMG